MKSLHRTKALAAYEGARLVLKNEMTYPAYMLLKEAARGVLSYIAEDRMETDISEKTKLDRLLEFMTVDLVSTEEAETIQFLVEIESRGLEGLLVIDTVELKKVKKVIKKLIGRYLSEPV